MSQANTRSKPWAKLSFFSFIIYGLISCAVIFIQPLTELETNWMSWTKEFKDTLLVHFASEIGALGSTMGVIIVSSVALVILLLLNRRRDGLQFLIAVCGSGMITGLSKLIISRDRPNGMAEDLGFYTSSFPSGHTLSAAAMYLTLALLASRSVSANPFGRRTIRGFYILAGIVIALVAVARTVTSTHFPTDSLAGGFAGVGWAALVQAYFVRHQTFEKAKRPVNSEAFL